MRPPRSSIRETSLNLPVDLLATIHSLVVILESREPQRFLAPEREVPVHGKRLVEELVDTLLQVPVEVDEHVATKNEVALREGAIGEEDMSTLRRRSQLQSAKERLVTRLCWEKTMLRMSRGANSAPSYIAV